MTGGKAIGGSGSPALTRAAVILAAVLLAIGLAALAAPQQAHAATSGTWHGVSYDMDDAGNVTFHKGTMTDGFWSSDPLYKNSVLKNATSVKADGKVVLPEDSLGLFNFCTKLTSIDMRNFDTSKVTSMSHMFYACSSLMTLDISSFDTSNEKKAQTLKASKVLKVSKAKGKVTYKLVSAKKGSKSFKSKFKVNAKTGKVTVKKGTKKGTYKVKVKVRAAGNAYYKAKTVTKTFKVKVK